MTTGRSLAHGVRTTSPLQRGDGPLFHHRTSFDLLLQAGDRIKSSEHFTKLKMDDEDELKEALIVNRWLQGQVGFYPLFLMVGKDDDDLLPTAYQEQFRIALGYGWENGRRKTYERRKPGEFPNFVLLSFNDLPSPVFLDEEAWFCVLNSSHCDYQIGPQIRKQLLKRSWDRRRWTRWATRHPVYAVVPELNPKEADRVWVRNLTTKDRLLKEGYRNVEVHRMKLGD